MSLGEIKDKLYKKEDYENSRLAADNLESAANDFGSEKANEDQWEKKPGLSPEQKKIIKIGAIIAGSILGVALIFFGAYLYRGSSFAEDKISLAIAGPTEGESGKSLVFEIIYNNLNRAALENSELRVSYPENFKPEGNLNFTEDGLTTGIFKLGEIKGKSQGKVIFSGKAYSPKGTLIYIKTNLSYTPSSINTQFSTNNQIGVSVTSSPMSIELLAPQNISGGDSIDYLVSYKNTGQDDFENIKIKAEFPEEFSLSRSEPVASESNNIWYVGHFSAGQEGKIVISGKMDGARNDLKSMKVTIGSFDQGQFVAYNDAAAETKIFASPISIIQTVNNLSSFTAKPGDTLFFSIKFRNEGNVGLRDVIVADEINSPVLDYETLDLRRGGFDFASKKITWKAPDYTSLKLLEPGQEDTITFSIKVKNIIPVAGGNDKNFVISSVAKIDSPDIPTPIEMNKIIAGNKLDIKLGSKIILDVKGFYNDSSVPNSGPIPPQVGQETTYSIHWIATNVSNDVANARAEATLPTGVAMTGKLFPENARIAYNERSNSIVWDIGNISAGTGILNPPLEAVFQIKIQPAPNQVGTAVDLVGPATFSGKDLFTGEDLSVTGEKKTTVLNEDSGIGNQFKVVN